METLRDKKVGGEKKIKRELRELKRKKEMGLSRRRRGGWRIADGGMEGWRDGGSSGRRGMRLDPDWKPNSNISSC